MVDLNPLGSAKTQDQYQLILSTLSSFHTSSGYLIAFFTALLSPCLLPKIVSAWRAYSLHNQSNLKMTTVHLQRPRRATTRHLCEYESI